jgi:hypothetical protein
LAAFVDHAGDVGDPDVLLLEAERDQKVEAGQGGGAGAGRHQLDRTQVLAHQAQTVGDRRRHDDRRAVLVVVEHRDLHALAQAGLDLEALGRLDVLKVDAAEGGLQGSDHVDQAVHIGLGHLDVEDVDAGELLEQDRLAFHDRLGGERPDRSQTQHRRAVGDHAHQIAPGSELGGLGRILHDRVTSRGHTRRVSERKVALCFQRRGRPDLQLAGLRLPVIGESGVPQVVGHDPLPPRLFQIRPRTDRTGRAGARGQGALGLARPPGMAYCGLGT